MMTDYLGSSKGGRPRWHGAHWIPVIVIAVILMSGRTTPDESGTLLAALLGALGWGFGPGGRAVPPLPA